MVQGDWYTTGKMGDKGHLDFDNTKALNEEPEFITMNGHAAALTKLFPLTANVGETVRLYVGNGGPNLISSFHVIGEIFDRVYAEGSTTPTLHNVQTTIVPAGGSAMVEFKVEVPGTYILVDHSLFRAFNKGAVGILNVPGEENALVFESGARNEPIPAR